MRWWDRWLVIGYQPPTTAGAITLDAEQWIEGTFLTSRGAMKHAVAANTYVITRKAWEMERRP